MYIAICRSRKRFAHTHKHTSADYSNIILVFVFAGVPICVKFRTFHAALAIACVHPFPRGHVANAKYFLMRKCMQINLTLPSYTVGRQANTFRPYRPTLMVTLTVWTNLFHSVDANVGGALIKTCNLTFMTNQWPASKVNATCAWIANLVLSSFFVGHKRRPETVGLHSRKLATMSVLCTAFVRLGSVDSVGCSFGSADLFVSLLRLVIPEGATLFYVRIAFVTWKPHAHATITLNVQGRG